MSVPFIKIAAPLFLIFSGVICSYFSYLSHENKVLEWIAGLLIAAGLILIGTGLSPVIDRP